MWRKTGCGGELYWKGIIFSLVCKFHCVATHLHWQSAGYTSFLMDGGIEAIVGIVFTCPLSKSSIRNILLPAKSICHRVTRSRAIWLHLTPGCFTVSALESPSASALACQHAQMVLSQVIQAVIRYGAHQTGARWAACCTSHCIQLSSVVVVTEGGSPELYCDSASKDYEQNVPKEAGGTVVAKKSRLHCRGCLRRPLGQLKLSEDWQETDNGNRLI